MVAHHYRNTVLRTALSLVGESVTGLRAKHQLGATHKLCVTHTLSINQISVGGLTANEYALDWVLLCYIVDPIHSDNRRLCRG
jgi:hypothetical protein